MNVTNLEASARHQHGDKLPTMADGKFPNGLQAAMDAAGLGPTELGRRAEMAKQDISRWAKGERELSPATAQKLAPLLGTVAELLIFPDSPHIAPQAVPLPNARIGPPVALGGTLIPLYGQAAGGKDGSFPWNGSFIQDIAAPPSLSGVRDAYAVLVVGSSMEPRYFAGEAVFLNPRLPVRRGDFVVAQIAGEEGDAPFAFVKRFVSRDPRFLRLEQLNPRKSLQFPSKRVVSIHRIVMGGEG